MRARAPGKLVLSGAYAVLRGAPALVTAVDRYVTADSDRAADFETPEVKAGLARLARTRPGPFTAPAFDASSLRHEDRKLGLGSSAAILLASLRALDDSPDPLSAEEKDELFALALAAHREAQGGGSGVDVAASCFGGTLAARLVDGALQITPAELPSALVWETWAMRSPASTSEFVKRVFAAEHAHPARFERVFQRQIDGSEAALAATKARDARAFVAALREEHEALHELGELASAPIILPEVSELHRLAGEAACFLPAGAGGGDVTLYVGPTPSPAAFRREAERRGLELIPLHLSAPGVTALPTDDLR